MMKYVLPVHISFQLLYCGKINHIFGKKFDCCRCSITLQSLHHGKRAFYFIKNGGSKDAFVSNRVFILQQ
jgi:hypothetical protein